MKKIIDGKRYDTDTATQVAHAEATYSKDDFRWYSEGLYKTPKGNWFIAGEGHAQSKWAVDYINLRGPGSGIIVLTQDQALQWCENHDVSLEIIEKFFIIEDA